MIINNNGAFRSWEEYSYIQEQEEQDFKKSQDIVKELLNRGCEE